MKPKLNSAAALFDKALARLDHQAVYGQIGEMKPHQCTCDDACGILAVTMAVDGDLHLGLLKHPNPPFPVVFPAFCARTWNGGGRNERVRKALMLLALAIKADTEQS